MDKPIRILMTALLVLLVAGSAMCDDGPYVDEVWTYDIGDNDQCCFAAGDEVVIEAVVCDADGHPDLVDMLVTANMSVFGGESEVLLTYLDTAGEYCAMYRGSTIVTDATCMDCDGEYGNYATGEGGDVGTECYSECNVAFPVTATDPSGLNDTEYGYADVEAGPCAQLNFTSIGYTTLLKWEYIEVNTDPDWSIFEWWDFYLYFNALLVTCQDEYGNDCYELDCDPVVTTTGHAGIVHDEFIIPVILSEYIGLDFPGTIVVVWNSAEVETCTFTAFCEDRPEITEATIDITFLEPIIQVNATAETDLYCTGGCSVDCTNVSAQILDHSGDPIPMPNVPVRFYVYGHGDAWFDSEEAYTDEEGIATSSLCLDDDSPGSVEARAVAEARMGSTVVPIVEPVLESIVLDPAPYESRMIGDGGDCFEACCYTDRGNMMQCPNLTWTSTNEYVATIVEYEECEGCCSYAELYAHHSGITNITACNGSICSDPTKVAVNGPYMDSACYEDNATIISDDVTMFFNFSDGGCAYMQAIGDPLMWEDDDCCNTSDMTIIKGAFANTWSCGDLPNDTYTLTICYNATTLEVMGIIPETLTILKCNTTDYPNCTWEAVGGSDNGSCVTVELDHLCLFALAGVATEDEDEDGDDGDNGDSGDSDRDRGSGGGGGGIYPPGWNTPTNATDADTDADGGNGTYPDEPENADDSQNGGVVTWTDEPESEGETPEGESSEGGTMAPVAVPDPTVPGFAGLIGIVAFVVIALLVKRRRT